MKITKARLKSLVREEVERYLLKIHVDALIDEELSRMGVSINEGAYEDYKKAARKSLMRKLAGIGVVGSLAGGIGGYGQSGANQHAADVRAGMELRQQAADEYKQTPDYALEELGVLLSNSISFSWTTKSDTGSMQGPDAKEGVVSQPENFPLLLDDDYGTIGILSPEYGVVRKVKADLQKQIDAGTTEFVPGVSEIIESSGTAEEWKEDFHERYGLPERPNFMNPDSGIVQNALAAGFKGDVGVSPHYNGMLYLPYDVIPKEMVMPKSGVTPSQYYMNVWNQHMNAQ